MIAFDSTKSEERSALRRSKELFTEKSPSSGNAASSSGRKSSVEKFDGPGPVTQGIVCMPNLLFC